MNLRGGDAEGGHPVRLQPDAHGEGAVAEDLGALHAGDGAQLRLHHAGEVVGDLALVEVVRREAEVGGGELAVGRLQVDDRRLRLGRKLVAHLRDLRLDLRERGVGVVVQFQVDGDRADALGAGRFDEIDPVGAGNDALERRRDEAAHEVGVRADVGRRHGDVGKVAARVLPDAQRTDRLQTGDEDHQADDHRQDGAADEEVCEFHVVPRVLLYRPKVWSVGCGPSGLRSYWVARLLSCWGARWLATSAQQPCNPATQQPVSSCLPASGRCCWTGGRRC